MDDKRKDELLYEMAEDARKKVNVWIRMLHFTINNRMDSILAPKKFADKSKPIIN